MFPALILIDINYCPFNNLLTGILYPILLSCVEYALCCLLEFLMIAVFDLQVSNEWPKVAGFTIQQSFEWNSSG